jgi:hypothetical protein
MKNYTKFLEEIDIKGNTGIPNEGEQQPGDVDYLNNIERRAKERLDIEGEGERDMGQYVHRLMGTLVPKVMRMTRGKESQLEELATQAIINQYGEILDGVKLDIKFGNPGENFRGGEEDGEEDGDNEPPVEFSEVSRKELLDKIHSAKIFNNIMQGEAINSKTMFHSDFLRNGIMEIFGDTTGEDFIRTLSEISETASKLDWLANLDQKANAMERSKESGQGFAGSVKVEWEKNEEGQEEEEDAKPYDLEADMAQDESEESNNGYTPVIRVRAIDFSMLLHETVKGIYELIASVSMPGLDGSSEDIADGQTVKFNVSSMTDEVADFRTGPEIAADFRDFINENPNVLKLNNMREFVFGKLCDPNYITPGDFLELFRGILNKTAKARTKIDSIIDEIIQEDKDYKYDLEVYDQEDKDSSDSIYNLMNQDKDSADTPSEDIETLDDSEVDYSKMKKGELQKVVDDALDRGDYELLRTLEPFMERNMLNIYSRELKMVYEKLKIKNKK